MPTDPNAVSAAASAAPNIDPATVMAAASTASSPGEAAGNAQVAAQYGNVTTMANAMAGMGVKEQHTLWSAQTPAMQSQLKAAGYNPPAQPTEMSKPGRGIFGDIGHVFGMAVSPIVKGAKYVGGAIASTLSPALNELGKPLGTVQHVVRAASYEMDLAHQAGQDWGNPFGKYGVFNPEAWRQGWDATNNGKTSFDPIALGNLEKQYGASKVGLAKQVVAGIDPTADAPANQKTAIAQEMNDPEFQQIVTQLNNAHLTLGQTLIGSRLLNEHPELHKLSGAIDATFDWYADPLNKPVQAATAFTRSKYAISDAQAAFHVAGDATASEAVLQQPAVQRLVNQAGGMLQRGEGNAFRTTFSNSIGKVYDQLVADGVDSPAKLGEWLTSKAGMSAVIDGSAARMSKGIPIFPHLSVAGWARNAIRARLRTSLDTLIDSPHSMSGVDLSYDTLTRAEGPLSAAHNANPTDLEGLADPEALEEARSTATRGGRQGLSRLTRTLGQYTPNAPTVGLTDANDFGQLRKALLYSLPVREVDQIGQMWVHANEAERFQIAQASVAQMLHYSGAFAADQDGSQRLLDAMDASYRKQAYAPLGIDKIGDSIRAALLKNQMSDRIHLPSLQEVRTISRKGDFLARMGVPLPGSSVISAAMRNAGALGRNFMGIWRPAVLARMGFPIRVALDENGNYLIRNGIMPMVMARVARAQYRNEIGELERARDAEKAAASGLDPETQGIARSVAIGAAHVPLAVLRQVKSWADLGTAALAERAWRVIPSSALGGLTKSDFYDFADLMTKTKGYNAFSPMVLAINHAGGGYDQAENLANLLIDGKPMPFRLRETGLYSTTNGSDDPGLFRAKWAKALDLYASDPAGRAALENVGRHSDTQMRAVLKVIQGDEYATVRDSAVRNGRLPDGRQVGVDAGVTTEMAQRAWARKIVAATNALVHSSDGSSLDDVVSEALANEGHPSMDTLEAVPTHKLPQEVFGPDLVPVSHIHDLIGRGMNRVAHLIDRLAREPNFLHAGARAMTELRPFVESVTEDAGARKELLADLSIKRAISDLKPYIHSPEVKTQFEVLHRTAAPFLFAQHQFLQRWGRTFLDNPAAIRKAQLAMNGLQTSGMIHKDQQGNWYFYYPGVGAATHAITDGLGKIGVPASLPISVPFTGELKYMVPGIANPVTPSVGPFVAMPLKALASLDPAFQGLDQAVLQQGASEGYLGQVLPSVVTRTMQAITGDGATIASMQIKAIQDAAATHNTLDDIAIRNGHVANGVPVPNANDRQQYLDRIKNWSRINMFMYAALGFAAPTVSQQNWDPHGLDARYQQLLNELPYNDALTEFLREHPDATPWTVSKSQTTGAEILPAATAAGKWLDANSAFVRDHQAAAGWFIPRTTGNAPFDPAVYREQIQYGLRNEKTPDQFLNDVVVAPASQTYYQVYDAKEAAIAANPNNTALKQQINSRFDQWRGQFLAMNPLFADSLQSSTTAARRGATIADINSSLNDPRLPSSPQVDNVASMAHVFDAWEQAYIQHEGNTSSASYDAQKALEQRVIQWGTQFASSNPDVSDLWNTVYLPQIRSITAGVAYPVNTITTGSG